ncbi:MAG: DUF5776 domain-containing protein [Levilactobacillus sp.]|jgi:hypothetical protein|uniref:DUF5776 domain-containing protein n=1 Tax=Levilactobacillus sp. TaxID=2767919 RepID=UPI00258DED36|nr:DUF5776 domain-containing protein [Levilactobacillus sp.]MCI1553423.1 DUF5776 domain-containing protein [Levilactobacillus sp.]MCI1597812.1 DUF5776 domain-containing protein [Levilactobacillus sp.]MCI1605580.1 DUF5776 domain-containing protein [Levilactobacillus sp.]
MRKCHFKFLLLAIMTCLCAWGLTANLSARADSLDLDQTIDQVLPSTSADPNEQAVRTALLTNPSLTGESTLDRVQKVGAKVAIDQPLTSYAPLIKIVSVLTALRLTDQTALSGDNLAPVIQAYLNDRPDKSAARPDLNLQLVHDQLTNTDLATILQIAQVNAQSTAPMHIKNLNLMQNQISDFSAWQTYKAANGLNSPITALSANPPDTNATVTLPAAKVTGNTVKLPFADLTITNADYDTGAVPPIAIAMGTQLAPYFDDPSHYDSQGGMDATNLTNQMDTPHWNIDPDNHTVDLTNLNTFTAQTSKYTIFYTPKSLQETADNFAVIGDVSRPEDLDNLTITNVPANAKQLQVNLLITYYNGSDDDTYATFTQKYTLPLTSPATTTPSTTPPTATTPEPTPAPDTVADQATTSPAKTATKIITATRKLGLYQSPNFSTKQRLHWYTQSARTQRPMFKILGVVRAQSGALRYHVKDVTPGAKTYGQTGYITAKADFVANAYYQIKATKIKVLRGLNSYRSAALTGRKHHYRKNQTIRVTKLVKHKLTTRYQLPNGRYVSANKRLVLRVK